MNDLAEATSDAWRPATGLCWQDQRVGRTFTTESRTVTAAAIDSFVGLAGFTEALFLDHVYLREQTPFGRQIAPGLLSVAVAEGLIIQSGVLRETAIALLGLSFKTLAPVFAGDTLTVHVEVTGSRSSSTPGRGVVTTRNRVVNQSGDTVVEYEVTRLIKGSADRLSHQTTEGHHRVR